MPRIVRVRFLHIGHENARMDDLELRLHDKQGRATDSTIWLRNGGGKSSILNLLFSLILPNRNDFLGGKANQGERKIDHYVYESEPGYVIIEWELDQPPMVFDVPPNRYLTGVAYEKRPGAAEDSGRLNRLFFATRVIDSQPKLTLDGLPIFIDNNEKLRTVAGFKQEWQALGANYAHADPRETESQQVWREILLSIGIDSTLFAYQVEMNRHEGGAEELFKFTETEEFVDFFLKLTLDPQPGASVVQNIETFRTALRDRAEQWDPELQLMQQVTERIQPLVGAHNKRVELVEDVVHARTNLNQLRLYLDQVLHNVQQAVDEAKRVQADAQQKHLAFL